MKTTILITAAALSFMTGQSQTTNTTNTSGKVAYDEKIKLEIKLEGESAQYSDMLPKEKTEKKILYFTPEVSVYQKNPEKKAAEPVEQETGGAVVQIQIANSDDKLYNDLKENKRIEQREFMTRMFLIESDVVKTEWKLTGAQKTILNYPCQEATFEKDGKKTRAWFTSAIPVSTGPYKFANLPGLILEVDVNDGERTFTATSVEFSQVDQALLAKPKEGKKVTEEKFKQIVDEKMKEMGAEGGGDGHQIMIKIQK